MFCAKSEPSIAGRLVWRSDLESQTKREKALRKGSRWFQWLNISINFCFLFQDTPFSFHFNEHAGRYVIKSSSRRKVVWAAFHLSGALVFWTEVGSMVKTIRASHDHYQYFDLLHSMGWLTFDYPIMYIWLSRMDKIQQFLDELQQSPLLLHGISSKRSRVLEISYGAGVAWYLFTTFAFFPVRWGVFDWSFENYYITLKSACELHLGIPNTEEGKFWYPLAILITFVLTTFQYNALLCRDMLAVGAVLTMKNIACDLDKAIKSGQFTDEDVLGFMEAQKRLTRKFNDAFGFLVSVYVVYASPYYALHFIDMVETPGLMNQLSMPTYVLPLGFACKWAIDVLVMAKRRKRWLVSKNRLMSLDRPATAVFLDDLTWEKYGLGRYYTVNAFVTGQVFSLIATVAIVRIQSMGRVAAGNQ